MGNCSPDLWRLCLHVKEASHSRHCLVVVGCYSWSRSREPGNGLPGVTGFLALGPGYYWHEFFSMEEVDAFRIHHLEMYGTVQNTAAFGPLFKEHGIASMLDDMDNKAVAHALLGSCP